MRSSPPRRVPVARGAADEPAASRDWRETVARDVVDELGALEFERVVARFDASLQAVLSARSLAQTWHQVLERAGHYAGVAAARLERRENADVFFLVTRFSRRDAETLVAVNRRGEVVGLAVRPQSSSAALDTPLYADRSRFSEAEVRVPDGTQFCAPASCGLPGTLSLPHGVSAAPAVVLLHGSGPQDRDESFGESRPFRDLAWGLATRGIAVLRYEKRTHFLRGRLTASEIESLTAEAEYVPSALGAIALLRRHPAVDARRIFVLGHSQGGAMLPRIGRRDADLAGFISLAGPLRPLEDIVLAQVRYLASLDGEEDAEETVALLRLETQVARVKKLRRDEPASPAELPLGIPAAYWLDLASQPPLEDLAGEARPFLVLQGERDYQVTLEDHVLWKAALAHSSSARFKTYPLLNHLFIEGHGRITPAEYDVPGHVQREVIQDIADFVHGSSARAGASAPARSRG